MRSLTNLSTAKATFLKAIIPTDLATYKQTCKTFVDAQLSKCYQVTVGYNLYEYAPNNRNNLLTALRADSVLIGTDAVPGTATTVELLAAGMYNLTKTPGNFYQNFQPNATDRRVLADSIASALTLYNNTPYATTPTVSGQVPTYARTNFMTAITSATTKRDNPLTIDTDVTGAIFGLYNAKLLFVSLIKK
jgi:hypothetical protein